MKHCLFALFLVGKRKRPDRQQRPRSYHDQFTAISKIVVSKLGARDNPESN